MAEGAGELSPAEKARFDRMARRSAIEVVACLEIIERRDEAADSPARPLTRLQNQQAALQQPARG
ncbi:MAG: four helix bundle protein [Myxococcales bacterium]|nr:four helix bundle protein [Myxococcales bacterium]